ncbi:hypothetical protein V5O48_004634 [Marasmius crinis-equi]|uniref:Uncharacterized protein n=1 Tax=Marasmius crinis-equi TaxID=585013 RepID=A0ABR3FPJ8_9AGAR
MSPNRCRRGFQPPDVNMAQFKRETNSPNMQGKNQHTNCPPVDDLSVYKALWAIHATGETNKTKIKAILMDEYYIDISESSITRRKAIFGIQGSGAATKALGDTEKRQIVLDQMAKDPSRMQGPCTIKEGIAAEQEIHLTRDFICKTMKAEDLEAFVARAPTAKKIHCSQLVVGDGHDKLSAIGFPIWGVRDVWSGKWLGLYVMPNNWLKLAVAYVWLKIVKEQGGEYMMTDCGSETSRVYSLATALREEFQPELYIDKNPAHRFLKSVSNITIERGWLRLQLQWGENMKIFWEAGATIYNPMDTKQ